MSSTAVSEAFRKVFDNNLQEVVDICLAMFVCVDGRVKFLQRFSNASNIPCQTFAAEAKKEGQPYEVLLSSSVLEKVGQHPQIIF